MAGTAIPKTADFRMATMRSRLQMAQAAFDNSRTDEVDDLKFLAGSPDNNWQWPSDVITSRTNGSGVVARPTLTINKLPQHVHQVTNDQRQNRATGKVIPANDSADAEAAEIFEGIVRHIEYISDADVAYDTACDNQVAFGEGYFRLLTKYASDDSFDQDIFLARIRNSFSVYMDPTMQDPCGADAKWAFITQDMLKTEYETAWPDKTPVSTLMAQGAGDESLSAWLDEETVRIAEYFYYETSKKTLNLWGTEDGDPNSGLALMAGSPEEKRLKELLGNTVKIKKHRSVEVRQVKWVKTNGYEVLEEQDWLGKWIPIVRVIGNEFEVEGRLYISGLVRNAKDAQRMYNYWTALSLDTPLPTPTGWTTMGAVKTGDVLYDDGGKPCAVLGTSPIYIGHDCFKITFDDGCEIIADSTHRWDVEERGKRQASTYEWSRKTLTTAELKAGAHFIDVPKPVAGSGDLPLDPYFLGVWLGDGDTVNPQITQSFEDVEELRQVLAERGLRVGAARHTKTAARFTVHGQRKTMVEMGVLGRKYIPTAYLRASVDVRLDLLHGLMDTDGSVSKTGQCSFTTTLEPLKEGLAELLHSLGVKFSTCERAGAMRKFPNGQTYQTVDSWQFSFSLRDDMRFFKLGRKVSASKTTYHDRRTKRFGIASVEPVASVPVKCVTVDNESHLFLAGASMIPTHNSQEAEFLALAPKAPFIGYAGQFEGYEEEWKTANTINHPYLQVNADPDGTGQTLPLPQRAPPPLPQAGLIQAKLGAADDIKGTTGQYDSSLGAQSQETSGKAIIAREKQGDVGTFHYADNLSRAIRHGTRQLIDLIPKIYDTQRVARIIGTDGEVSTAKIDPTQKEPVKEIKDPQTGKTIEKIYNLGVGTYDVMVTTGPNYMTKRQELLDVLTHILQSKPELWDVLGDLLFKEMDFEGARELSRRMKTVMNPKIFENEDSPGVTQAQEKMKEITQVLQQATEHMQGLEQQLHDKQIDQRIAEYDAETRRMAALAKQTTPEEAQAVIMQTIHEMMLAGDLPIPGPGGHPAPESGGTPPAAHQGSSGGPEASDGPMMAENPPPTPGGPGGPAGAAVSPVMEPA